MHLALAPLHLDGALVPLLLGAAFGATLERSGFGDARRLAAQFTLTELRVLKVMFTAIVTCLLWITLATSVGWMDFGALAVNPTYLGTAVVGGLLLGMGFVVGGYCPGTSIVSAATGKVDGMFFLGGVGAGVFVFGEVGGAFRTFYDTAGALGRVTLPDVLGLPFGAVVALVVLMAAAMFVGAEALERRFGPTPAPADARPGRPRLARAGALVAVVALLAAFASPAAGDGAVEARVALLRPAHDATLASRAVHVDPVEMAGLLHRTLGGKPARFDLVILDVRDPSSWNRFHLEDARSTTLARLAGEEGRALADARQATSIKVVVGDDEARAEAAWRLLAAHGVRHVYVLAGGVNLWLDVWRDGRLDAQPARGADATDTLRHAFPSSLGARLPYARPDEAAWRRILATKARAFEPRVKPVTKAAAASGGCG